MANSFEKKLKQQIKNNRAVAELGNRGHFATVFSDGVPDFDLLVHNSGGNIYPLKEGEWEDHTDIQVIDRNSISQGYRNQLTRQVGESLAVAKLGENGFIASAFAGNVPDFDILACNNNGKTLAVQIKATRHNSSQLKLDKFINVKRTKRTNGMPRISYIKGFENLIYMFVKVEEEINDSKFYILKQELLAKFVKKNHVAYLKRYDGNRRDNNESKHTAIKLKTIEEYENNWECLE